MDTVRLVERRTELEGELAQARRRAQEMQALVQRIQGAITLLDELIAAEQEADPATE